ncbi:MAG: ATP-binding protein [Bacilli bacterium]|jgi:signal transduction histidine kinase|nr:ATP-binding protein [Bacilli bacterium]
MNKHNLIIASIAVFIFSFLSIFLTTLFSFKSIESGIVSSTRDTSNSILISLNSGLTERDAMATYGVNKNAYISFYEKDEDQPYFTNISVTEEKTFAELSENEGKTVIYDSKDIGSKVCETFFRSAGIGAYVRYDMVVPQSYYASYNLLVYGTTTVVALISAGIALFWVAYEKSLTPLKTQVRKLQGIVTPEGNVEYGDDFSYLPLMIRDSRKELERQLQLTKTGEQKINFILDSISQGLIVLDASYKIVMINKTACDVFKVAKDEVENRNMDAIKPSRSFEVNASMVVQTKKAFIYTEPIYGRVYQININPIDYSWARVNERNGASILFIDVTDEFNSSKMKREFFDNASHELKSPLTTILGYQQMLKAGILSTPEEISGAVDTSIKECHRMNEIIIDMLSLSSLENEELRPVEDIDTRKGLVSIAASLEPQMKAKKVSLSLNSESFSTKMNPDDFDKLFRNLIDNAIKYDKTNGHIWVSVNKASKTISVKDDGIGISEANQTRIFERFFRVDKARSRESGGTGLGLAIVKHVCNYYDLRIELSSKLGSGSEFIVHL